MTIEPGKGIKEPPHSLSGFRKAKKIMTGLGAGKAVLIGDDSITIRRVVKNELIQLGFMEHQIREAGDGKSSSDILANTKFDMVISDWNLPKMNGLDLLKHIRSTPKLKDIPFLMLTSEANEENILKALEEGADQYITKPFKATVLEETIKKILSAKNVFGNKKVLVVDDSPVMRRIIKKNLKQAGFLDENILESLEGDTATDWILVKNFDLIISDWHMPKVDGLEFFYRLQAYDDFKDIPFLMVTSEAQKVKVMEALNAGISNYILKPFTAMDLEKKIKQIISKK